jgi:hypothetical protein
MPASKPWSAPKILAVLGLVVVGIPTCGIGGALLYRHHRAYRGERLGLACGYSGECAAAPCIHDAAESYCSKLCESDGDCPAPYVCEPTRSGRRRACMKGGAPGDFGVTRRRR